MKFSNSGEYLLSVSRDRTWKLFKRNITEANKTNDIGQFKLVRSIATKNPFHTRIVWSCDWSHDDKFFVTTSRDKRACVWCGSIDSEEMGIVSDQAKPVSSGKCGQKAYLELCCSITACAFAPGFTTRNE